MQNQQVIANTALGKLRLDASRLIVRFGQETLYASYASFLLAYVDGLGHTSGLHADLVLASVGREPQTGTTPEIVAEFGQHGRHLDRLVFGFADHAHEWTKHH